MLYVELLLTILMIYCSNAFRFHPHDGQITKIEKIQKMNIFPLFGYYDLFEKHPNSLKDTFLFRIYSKKQTLFLLLEENNIIHEEMFSNIENIHHGHRSFHGRLLPSEIFESLLKNGIKSTHLNDKDNDIGWARITLVVNDGNIKITYLILVSFLEKAWKM